MEKGILKKRISSFVEENRDKLSATEIQQEVYRVFGPNYKKLFFKELPYDQELSIAFNIPRSFAREVIIACKGDFDVLSQVLTDEMNKIKSLKKSSGLTRSQMIQISDNMIKGLEESLKK